MHRIGTGSHRIRTTDADERGGPSRGASVSRAAGSRGSSRAPSSRPRPPARGAVQPIAPDTTSERDGRRAPLHAHQRPQTNARVIERYLNRRANAEDVLKVTTSVIGNSDLEGAFACMKAMQEAGVAPDVITYNALISACGKSGQVERALGVFKEMRDAGRSEEHTSELQSR